MLCRTQLGDGYEGNQHQLRQILIFLIQEKYERARASKWLTVVQCVGNIVAFPCGGLFSLRYFTRFCYGNYDTTRILLREIVA